MPPRPPSDFSMPRVDAHVHLWDPIRGDYGWLTPKMTPLYRRFGHTDVKPLLDAANIAGAVLIQAAATSAETDYLLAIAESVPWVLGVVGWVDLDAEDVEDQVARRAKHPKFVGVRPMLQDIEDPLWILDPRRSRALKAMERHRLVFDALIRPVHLDAISQVASDHPDLAIVIDHAAKPTIGWQLDQSWQSAMRRASRLSNVKCKISGLMTELAPGTDTTMIGPHVETLLELFAHGRLIWGSDWPVLTTAATYAEWFRVSQLCLARLDQAALEGVMGGNAIRTYRMGSR
jgi:L-fuconolactonase